MPTRRLETEIWLPQPFEEVFGFFSDASNLEAITPPWLHFKIVTPSPNQTRLCFCELGVDCLLIQNRMIRIDFTWY